MCLYMNGNKYDVYESQSTWGGGYAALLGTPKWELYLSVGFVKLERQKQ